ncbi:MAG TPA: hypothetical protein VLA17_03110 [Candidatus Limnocylindria bacterium]|nr:hypothetical protein [Candidatus Limnocylindria bacterium]
MNRSSAGLAGVILLSFCAGFLAHLLYLRWNPTGPQSAEEPAGLQREADLNHGEPGNHRVTFAPFSPAVSRDASADLPVLAARDVEKIRALTGQQAKIRGRVFRVGHSAKSNTYFLNFGPSREALTAVIFASAVELFDKAKLPPQKFENREVEVSGSVKDHPQYGVEIILEHPKQIRILD